ncbi:hypothetical protein Q4247_10170 [Acinetobacter baumannii]
MVTTCEKCFVNSSVNLPIGWNKIVNFGEVDDLSGGTEWQQFECCSCGSTKNIKYRDIGISKSGWFFKNEFPEFLGNKL